MDDSVAQIDKLSSVASAKPFDRPGDDSSMKGSAGETKQRSPRGFPIGNDKDKKPKTKGSGKAREP